MPKVTFEETLERINREGNFEASVLATPDGLPIATAPAGYDSDVTAAMVALLKSVAQQTQDHVGMAPLDEVSIRASDHMRLVCRSFQVDGEDFILAVVVPREQRYHRQLTNRAIRELTLTWHAMVQK
ncbi:MAG: roadblock/LC7 domain-containing protein [Anaerolineae bacterium]|jgi:predicted regulator of Ras-like GTPase activity (Roadblock/LC7/MglB family)|nr:roadblock/LC7 domain-containing protein [Anaerolineae bacterium]